MKKLNVVQRGKDWVITGFSDGGEIPIYYRIPYPETEWPEIGEVKGHKEMLRALYDLWQTSDELSAENKAHGGNGLLFHTPFGDFATYSFHVVPAEDAARIANEQEKEESDKFWRVKSVFEGLYGFGKDRLKAVTSQYGSKFADWPLEEAQAHHRAEAAAHNATHAYLRGDIEALVTQELCAALAKK